MLNGKDVWFTAVARLVAGGIVALAARHGLNLNLTETIGLVIGIETALTARLHHKSRKAPK